MKNLQLLAGIGVIFFLASCNSSETLIRKTNRTDAGDRCECDWNGYATFDG